MAWVAMTPARHVAGATRNRSLDTSAAVVTGTMTLRDRDGTTIAGPITLSGGVAAVACPADELGGGYTERWAVSLDGESKIYVIPAIVSASDLDAPISPDVLEAAYPIGLSSAQALASIDMGWSRVLLDLVQRTRARMDAAIVSPADLAEACLYASASAAAVRAGALTGGVARDWMTVWELRYEDAWARVALQWDTDGTGTPGTDPERQTSPGFPGPSPQAGR